MASSIERYQKDVQRLQDTGIKLVFAMQKDIRPESKIPKDVGGLEIGTLPDFVMEYQAWYSEALALITQLIPERAEDFKAYYTPKTPPKEWTFANYTISNYLRGLRVTRGGGAEVIVDRSAALQPMMQQLSIVQGLARRFTSSLFDIKTLVHADLLDDELQAAEELNKNGFQRGAGAVAGVVLESHLAAVAERHTITIRKKDPSIADLNEALKSASIIDIPQWRFNQHLGDLRNKCDHKKATDPTKEEVGELIEGVRKVTKTLL